MTENYSRTLFGCILASLVLLFGITALGLPPWVTMCAAMIPLVYYHLGYLSPRAKKGISHAAIDSVYYFGFLITIAALGLGSILVANSKASENVSTVAFQFGLGLLGTGYAVAARVHLTSVSVLDQEANAEVTMGRIVLHSQELANNVHGAAWQFGELANTLTRKCTEAAETSRQAMLYSTQEFEKEMIFALKQLREGLNETRAVVNDPVFKAERIELAKGIRATVHLLKELNASVAALTASNQGGAAAALNMTSSAARLNETMASLNAAMLSLGGEQGTIENAAKALKKATEIIAQGITVLVPAVESLEDVGQAIGGLGPSFKSLRVISKKATEQLEVLASVSASLEPIINRLNRTAEATSELAIGLDTVRKTLASVNEQSTALVGGMDHMAKSVTSIVRDLHGSVEQSTQALKDAISVSSGLLESDVKRSSQAASLLTAKLTEVAQTIIDRTREQRPTA